MDYFERAEEKLYGIPELRQRLRSYEAARDKLIRRTGPSGIAPIDLTKPAVKSSKREEDYSAVEKIAYYQSRVDETRDAIEQVTTAVDQLQPEQQRIIDLWYFQKMPKAVIMAELYISGVRSLYNKRRAAVTAFANIFPW